MVHEMIIENFKKFYQKQSNLHHYNFNIFA